MEEGNMKVINGDQKKGWVINNYAAIDSDSICKNSQWFC